MAISYPLALPTVTGIKSVTISPISIVGITRSIYTLEGAGPSSSRPSLAG